MKKLTNPSLNCLLFLLLAVAEFIWMLFLIFTHRIPLDHDGLTNFFLPQYYFLNAAASHNEIPLWTPYMTHGTTMTWWYTIQGQTGLFQSAFALLGKFLQGWNFLPIFHMGIFVDRMILLIGTWLLSREFFRSPFTQFFVASLVMGSTVVYTQFKFTLYIYFAIPLILFFLHQFLKSGQWRWLFLAFYLFVIQTIGNDAYFIPISSLVIFCYFLTLLALTAWERQLPRVAWTKSCLAYLLLAGTLAIALGALFLYGKDPQLFYNNTGRLADGNVALDVFLTYGGNTTLKKWGELFLRSSPGMDYTLYMSFLAIPLLIIGALFSPRKERFPLLATFTVLFLLSMATPFSKWLYYTWPLMKFYRHLSLLSPLIKLFLCFLAGFGFETVFHSPEKQKKFFPICFSVFGGIVLSATAWKLWQLAQAPALAEKTVKSLIQGWVPLFSKLFTEPGFVQTFYFSSVLALALAVLLFIWPFGLRKKFAPILLGIILVVHIIDIYSYSFYTNRQRTFALAPNLCKFLAFQPIPYQPRRDLETVYKNERKNLLNHRMPQAAIYTLVDNFLFLDEPGTGTRIDHWQRGFDRLIRTFQGLPLDDPATSLRQPWRGVVEFPTENPVAAKIAGLTEDKIQFFARGILVPSPHIVATYLAASTYSGDILFYERAVGPSPQTALEITQKPFDLKDNDRLSLAYRILKFSPNQIQIEVDAQNNAEAWLLYSDMWHPYWKCRINNRPTPVFIGNLAYKAVALKPGKNLVYFYFECRPLIWLYQFFMLNCFVWMLLFGWFFWQCCQGKEHSISLKNL